MATSPLTRDRIVEEAIALLDEEGPDALSMRRLATRLGTSTMSTYHHLPDKAALVEEVAESVMAGLEFPGDEVTWPNMLRQLCWSFRSLTSRHPAVFRVMLSGPRPAALTRTAASVIARLEAEGFDAETARMTFRTFIRYLLGVTLVEAGREGDDELDATFAAGIELLVRGVPAPGRG